jgi:hypothetical protein
VRSATNDGATYTLLLMLDHPFAFVNLHLPEEQASKAIYTYVLT